MARKRTALNSALNAAAGRSEPEKPAPEKKPRAVEAPEKPIPKATTLRPEGKAVEVLKPLTTRVEPAVFRQLKVLAAEQDRPLMYLLGEAINLLFEKHGKPPIAAEKVPGKD